MAGADGPGHSNGSGLVQFSAQPTLVGTFVRSLQYVSTSDAYSTVSSLCSTSISTFSSNSLDSSSSNLRHFPTTSTEHSCFSTFSTLSSPLTLVHRLLLNATVLPTTLPALLRAPLRGSMHIPTSSTHARIYTFDLNEHWQPDKDHYDNQKINGLTLPKTIRSYSLLCLHTEVGHRGL